MAKIKKNTRPDFQMGSASIPAGTRRTVHLDVPDLYTHTGLTIPVRVLHGKKDGPTLFLSAAVHGDEINGVEIIRRVLASKRVSAATMNGTLLAVPVVNIFGFLNQSRYLPDRRDLNRLFPGTKSGSLAGRMAHLFVTEIVDRATHGIDLHTAAINRENLPQIRAVLDEEEMVNMASAFGLPVTLNTSIIDGSLRAAAEARNIKVLVYEAGEALRFDEVSIRAGVDGVISVMQEIGMLKRRTSRRKVKETYVAKRTVWVRAPQSGILRTICRLGARVKRGDIMGYLADPLGDNEAEVIASTSGIVIGRTTIPLISEGEALFHIATFEEPDKTVAEVVDETHQMLQPDDDELKPAESPIV